MFSSPERLLQGSSGEVQLVRTSRTGGNPLRGPVHETVGFLPVCLSISRVPEDHARPAQNHGLMGSSVLRVWAASELAPAQMGGVVLGARPLAGEG
ncbi:unnamed protein product [Lota lota]